MRSWDVPDDSRSSYLPVRAWRRWWEEAAAVNKPAVHASATGFTLTVDQLSELGVSRARGRTEVRRGRWVQAARGVLAPVDVSRELPAHGGDVVADRRRHALRAAGAARGRPTAAVAGRSAAVLHGLPTLRVPPSPELLAFGDVGAGNRATSHVFTAELRPGDVTEWYGIPLTTVARTLVELARHDRLDAIMAVDAACRELLVEPSEIDRALDGACGWPGVRQARAVLRLADGRAESPLESVTRLRILDDGLPAPRLQHWIGAFRVDFYWPASRVVLEADGRVKYTADELWAEKTREQTLRRLGIARVERVTWPDVLGGWPTTYRRLRSILT